MPGVSPEELEQLRRSIVMVEGNSVGPLPKQAALDLIKELARLDRLTRRYQKSSANFEPCSTTWRNLDRAMVNHRPDGRLRGASTSPRTALLAR